MHHDCDAAPVAGAETFATCPRCGDFHAWRDDALHAPVCADCLAIPDGAIAGGGLHVLDACAIERAVERTAPGSYALGYLDGATFTVFYVGRSDTDVRSDLAEWVGAPSVPRPRRPTARMPWQSRSEPYAGAGARAQGVFGPAIATAYTHFAFDYARSPFDAFEQECRAYHRLGGSGGLDNGRHPEPPAGASWACPVHCS